MAMTALAVGTGLVLLALIGLDSKDLLLSSSAFAAGVMVYLAIINIRAWAEGRLRYGWAYALLRGGTAIIVLIVAETVNRLTEAPRWDWRVIAYQVGLGLIILGGWGVVKDHRASTWREHHRRPG